MVFHSALWKVLSFIRRAKLSNPMNSIGLAPSHFTNARKRAKNIGTSVKIAKPIKFGAIKL
ncbi:hypothetical protein D3C85_1781700 [compost metagenome]